MRRGPVVILVLFAFLLGIASGEVARRARRAYHAHVARTVRAELLAELKTVTLKNCTLKRYGGSNDGGYLMCENLVPGVQSAYSYGISEDDDWGCQLSRDTSVAIHQYDCFTDDRPTCEGGRFIFHDECVGPRKEKVNGEPFDTVEGQIARNGDTGKRLIVKMDVEGAEWESLMQTPDSVLDTIDQLPIEFHGVDDPRFSQLIRRLKTKFHLVSVHFNNSSCSPIYEPMPAWAYQLLFVNKRLGELDPAGPSPARPSPLLTPDNMARPDCQSTP